MHLEQVVAQLVERIERRFYGKYRAFVVDNADPRGLARLKLSIPSVLGAEVVSGWAMPCAPFGGDADQGFLAVPEVGAGVWVEFEEGDLEFPIWVGTFWSQPGGESETPRPTGADTPQDPPTRKILKSTSGHSIELEDKDGEETVLIRHKENAFLAIDPTGTIVLSNSQGSSLILNADDESVVLVDQHGNSVQLTADGANVTNQDGSAAVVLSADMARVIAKTVVLEGSSVSLGAGAQFPTLVVDPTFQQMWNLFANHTHPTAMGPSGPPLPPGPILAPGSGLTSAVTVK